MASPVAYDFGGVLSKFLVENQSRRVIYPVSQMSRTRECDG
jgi:hypothetical protein